MPWGFLAFCAFVLVVLAPLVVLALQFSILGRQRKLVEQFEQWLPKARRQFIESRRLLEDLARRIAANDAAPGAQPQPSPSEKYPSCSRQRRRLSRCRRSSRRRKRPFAIPSPRGFRSRRRPSSSPSLRRPQSPRQAARTGSTGCAQLRPHAAVPARISASAAAPAQPVRGRGQ